MGDVTSEAGNPADPAGNRPVKRGRSVAAALTIAVASAIVAVGATIVLTRGGFGAGAGALLVALAVVAFGATAYGLMQAALAIVDTAGERRRQDREVSERRQGDRPREPRKR